MNEKLHQNRIVIVGRSHQDARDYSNQPQFRDTLEAPVLISTASHRLTILGSTGGTHAGSIYVTATAPEGENFSVIEDVIASARRINPAVKVVEEPRTVSA